MPDCFKIAANIVDVIKGEIFPGEISIEGGRITAIERKPGAHYDTWITPGFVDAHVHVESSLLAPTEFARAAAIHGTVASVSDPHEIANVLGLEGVHWMIQDAKKTPFKIYYGAPSCVPATPFETAGAHFGPEEVDSLLALPEIKYLSEVMNFPAVINRDPFIMSIVETAKKRGKRIDGHSPGVLNRDLERYASAGIETDHECTTLEEALQRCRLGMKVAIREGSAARNFEALWPVLNEYPDQVFFCSDDKHPDDLVVSHINAMAKRAVAMGCKLMDVLRAATRNPVQHYGLEVGLLQVGDPADFVEWDNLQDFNCLRTCIQGQWVAENGKPLLPRLQPTPINRFHSSSKTPDEFALPARPGNRHRVIVALDGQLLTGEDVVETTGIDVERDLLKITVVNRYGEAPPAVALIRNFGLKEGALASSVAHDSHNIVAVGTNDKDLCRAVNLISANGGGLCAVQGRTAKILPLPIAGLMSDGEAWEVAESFTQLNIMAKQMGCSLKSPFMTLSFMALLVIPQLKLSDLGLFDVSTFSLIASD